MGMMQSGAPATLQSAVSARIEIDGKPYINFGGSSYLGLASNPEILNAGIAALRESGAGTPIPRDHGLAMAAHQAVEAEAAIYFNTPAALYLPNGYLFGLIAIGALAEPFNILFFDEGVHYSLRDAIAASGLASQSFRHLDATDLQLKLKRLEAGQRPVVVSDGLFSTWGEIAPLHDVAEVVAPYGGKLLVDESHSFGVLGSTGRGAIEHHGLKRSALIGGSLGKAFGTSGGIIPATQEEVARFRRTNAARGATAGLAAAAAMCACSLGYVRRHPELLVHLRENIKYMKSGLRALGLKIADTVAPIASFTLQTPSKNQALKAALMAEGIFVYHSTYVGAGKSGVIRCGIFADHTVRDIDRLLDSLRRLL